MYPDDTMSSSIPIPKTRRRYMGSPMSSPVVEASPQPQLIKGYAHLCFCDDGTWFEGHVVSEDGSQYGITGSCPFVLNSDLFDRNKTDSDTTDVPFVAYDVTVTDNDDEETYKFPSVTLTSFYPLCGLLSPRFSFTAEKSYHGQKADMLIQRYLTPRLVGKNLRVCAGQLNFDVLPTLHSLPTSFKVRSPLWCL